MRILVLSDSHGSATNMDRALKAEQHDYAVHLGDHMMPADYMSANFDYWVAGNNDYDGEDQVVFRLGDKTFLAFHGHLCFSFTYKGWLEKMAAKGEQVGAQIVLFGHSHFPEQVTIGKIDLLNPGSITLPRSSNAMRSALRSLPSIPSYLLITLGDGTVGYEFKTINPE